jgi:UDP-N-acetylmuramoyl-tripeptide--D-alanyl-D-alanine ligase
LILEMGADKPGDMKYLTSFIKPKIAVVTRVAHSHIQYFGDLAGVTKEKAILVEGLNENGWAVLNYDDENVRAMQKRIPREHSGQARANVLFFGLQKGADIIAFNLEMNYDGLGFDVKYKSTSQHFHINAVGRHQVYSALAGIACGIIYGFALKDIAKNLSNYKTSKDRTNVLKGIKKSTIINDVYNANPESVSAGLELLNDLNNKNRRVVVLGDMLELGKKSKEMHLGIGQKIRKSADEVILVGERMRDVYDFLQKEFNGRIYWYEDSVSAGQEIGNIIGENDIILVKGSRGMKMEKIVERIKL